VKNLLLVSEDDFFFFFFFLFFAVFLLTSIPPVITAFPDAFALMWELQEMGENNAVRLRRPFVPKETFLSMAAAYQGLYGNPNGTVSATFHVSSPSFPFFPSLPSSPLIFLSHTPSTLLPVYRLVLHRRSYSG
jgi:hypothetical protein